MSIERSIPSATCKEHLESYSIKVKLQPVNICSCLQLSTGASWAPPRGGSWSSSPKTRPEPARGRGRSPTGRWGENIPLVDTCEDKHLCRKLGKQWSSIWRREASAETIWGGRCGSMTRRRLRKQTERRRAKDTTSREWMIFIATTIKFFT